MVLKAPSNFGDSMTGAHSACSSLQKLPPQYLMQSLPLLLQSPKSWEQKKTKPKQSPNPAKSQNYQQLIIVSMFFPSFLCIWRIFEVSFHCLFSLQQKSSQICSGMDKPKISNTESATQRLCRRTAKLSFKLVAFLQKKFFMANFFFVCVDTVKQSYIKSAHPLILRAIFLI